MIELLEEEARLCGAAIHGGTDPAWRVEMTGIAVLLAIFPPPRADMLDI